MLVDQETGKGAADTCILLFRAVCN